MVRNEISQKVGQKVHVKAQVSVPWNGRRESWCIQKIVIDGQIKVDHSWVQIIDNPEISDVGRNSRRGDWIEFDAEIGQYHKRGGVVDYNIVGGVQ